MSVRYQVRRFAEQVCPPILLSPLKRLYRSSMGTKSAGAPSEQNLAVYWDAAMEEMLETWGEGNVWSEIQLAMAGREGRVLDIACGTGKTIEVLAGETDLELWGCDISDRLISRAVKRGISPERLYVGDATRLPYEAKFFNYSYSIGSIEHFTEDGIAAMLAECRRVTRKVAFHTHPVSKSGRDEGWITTVQSYFNNSPEWWAEKYRKSFSKVLILDSLWRDERSVGKWFVCS
jgi:ubiquinone/menaquinone biosynthesis C-methylase UbiE